MADNGVKSKVDFYRNLDDLAMKDYSWKPLIMSQKYSDGKLGYEVATSMHKSNLSVNLKLISKSDLIHHIEINSNLRIPELGKYHSSESIVIVLKDEYRRELIKQNIIPEDSKTFIHVDEVDGIRSTTIQTTNSRVKLENDILKEIQDEINFDWNMDGEETKGTFGDRSFAVNHVNPLSLDPERVWDSLTGKQSTSGEPMFIFPVKVERINSK